MVSHVRASPSISVWSVRAFNDFTNDRLNVSRLQNLPIRRSAEDLYLVALDSCALFGGSLWLRHPELRELIAFYPGSSPFRGVME